MIDQSSKITNKTVPFKSIKVGEYFEDRGIRYKKKNKMEAVATDGSLLRVICTTYLVNKADL
jgi:hypothetical protein